MPWEVLAKIHFSERAAPGLARTRSHSRSRPPCHGQLAGLIIPSAGEQEIIQGILMNNEGVSYVYVPYRTQDSDVMYYLIPPVSATLVDRRRPSLWSCLRFYSPDSLIVFESPDGGGGGVDKQFPRNFHRFCGGFVALVSTNLMIPKLRRSDISAADADLSHIPLVFSLPTVVQFKFLHLFVVDMKFYHSRNFPNVFTRPTLSSSSSSARPPRPSPQGRGQECKAIF